MSDLTRKIRRIRKEPTPFPSRKPKTQTKDSLQEYVNSLKRTPCADCKQRFPACAMDLDHLPQYRKKFTISQFIRAHGTKPNARALLEAEIAKCAIVCAVCHRIRTWMRQHRGGK